MAKPLDDDREKTSLLLSRQCKRTLNRVLEDRLNGTTIGRLIEEAVKEHFRYTYTRCAQEDAPALHQPAAPFPT